MGVGVGVNPSLPPLGVTVGVTLRGEGEGVGEKVKVGVVVGHVLVVEDRVGVAVALEVNVTFPGDEEDVREWEEEDVGLEVLVGWAGLGEALRDRVVESEREAELEVVEEGEFVRLGAPGLAVEEVVGVEDREAGRD